MTASPEKSEPLEKPPLEVKISIVCSCGDRFTQPFQLKNHVADTGHDLASGETERLQSIARSVSLQIESVKLRLAFLQADINHLESVVRMTMAPTPPRVTLRLCVQCKKPTRDTLGGVARCAKHTARGDVAVTSIIEKLLYGKS